MTIESIPQQQVDELDAEVVGSVNQDDDLGRPVRILWIDSGLAVHGWTQRHEMPAMVETVESVGLWMGENDDVVMIGGTRDKGNHSWLNCQLIWKESIRGKEWLDEQRTAAA